MSGLHMPYSPLQNQLLLSVMDYGIALGNILLQVDMELNLMLTAAHYHSGGMPVKCHGFKLLHLLSYNNKGGVDIANPQLAGNH